MRPVNRPGLADTAGYSLVELLVAMGLFTVVMGATLGGLADVMKGNQLVMNIASMNESARGGMDLMVRDLLQVGSGLPSSHAITIPSGDDSEQIRLPGPPGMPLLETGVGDLVMPAVITHNGAGPVINGVATDVLTVLMADNAFLDVNLTATADSQVTVATGVDIGSGPDRVLPGQLMLISKGSSTTLVQVTDVDSTARILYFADDDSLRLNQSGAENGSLAALNAEEPEDDASLMRISRIRMITYYIDNTEPAHPRLVRRINNGDAGVFDNTLGTAVALDVEDLQFTFDISNGEGNPGGVEMNAADFTTSGSCAPVECAHTQIRKINVELKSRSSNPNAITTNAMSNLLQTQVSLRAMAFVDRYQ